MGLDISDKKYVQCFTFEIWTVLIRCVGAIKYAVFENFSSARCDR